MTSENYIISGKKNAVDRCVLILTVPDTLFPIERRNTLQRITIHPVMSNRFARKEAFPSAKQNTHLIFRFSW